MPDSLIQVENYEVSRLDRNWGGNIQGQAKKGGGLLCFVRKDIKFSDSKYMHLNNSSEDLEMQWILLTIPNVRPIVIVNIYRPPQGNYKKGCTLLSEAFAKADLGDNADVFLLGDWNINLNQMGTPSAKELIFTTKTLGLKQLIKEPSRISFRNGIKTETKIDLIFLNSDFISQAGILDLNISDHLAVMVTRKKVALKKEKVEFKGRSYRNYNRENFQGNLENINWDGFYEERDPNRLWELMEGNILKVIDEMCPIKSFKVAKFREPWITNESIEAIKDKDRLLRKARKSGREEDWAIARRARNRVGRDLELLRADYLKEQQEEHKSDPKKFWEAISPLLPNKKRGTGPIWIVDQVTGEEIGLEGAPNHINEFFTGIGPKLAQKLKERWVYYGEESQQAIMGAVTTNDEVLSLCRDINTMKSSGLDRLSTRVCKDAFKVLSDKLVHMFNCSLERSIFPTAWKAAKIVPLFKGGAREDVGNYRPVSLLPLPGKLLEKIVHKRLSQFFDAQGYLTQNQGGFRKGFSTTATIADLTDDLYENVNKGLTTLAAFIDLKKAFDTVNTHILTQKLYKAGVRGNMLQWCKNYLSGRKQCTIANGHKSGDLPVVCGVPQGSVLGPLFFLVYVNDLQFVLENCGLKLYADDTVIYQEGVNCQTAEIGLQISMDKFAKWCSQNALTINVKKTKLMAFGSRSKIKKCNKAHIRLNGERLKLTPSFKYLGITLDSTLNFGQHVSSIVRMVHHKISLLGRIKKYLKNDVALKIYKSSILPYLDYADPIFHNARAADLDKLQRLQNRCLRVCLGHNRDFSTNRAHKDSGTPFLKDRRKAHTLNFMYVRKDKKPSLLNKREIRTRAHDAPLFLVGVPRCEAYKRSVCYHGATAWNDLAPATRNIDTYEKFKNVQRVEMSRPLDLIN